MTTRRTDLLAIGRFSTMTRLSIKALRFYDEQGLLAPAWIDPSSGYRYYARVQAGRAEAIRVLRQTDMPVEEVRELLGADDPELTGKRLAAHRERLRKRLAEQERMLRFLERLIEGGGVLPYEAVVKDIGARTVASVTLRTGLGDLGASLGRGFGLIDAAGVRPSGAPFVVYHDVIDEKADGRIEICVPVPAGATVAAGEVSIEEVPGGTVVATTHRGPYAEISPAYHFVTGWIEEHGYEAAGAPREIYLNDPRTAAPDDLLTEVQFPISAR